MNSYPAELLVQLAPVMFAAGLEQPSQDSTVDKPQDAFLNLVQRLRESFLAQSKFSVWNPERSKSFQVVLVDKAFSFPPRKIPIPNESSQTFRSPLSPSMPSSPLYPDGVISPLWIRKHTTLVPSVFVLFLRLYETPPSRNHQHSPLDPTHGFEDKGQMQDERRRDIELSAEISERKKLTNERGIKLTVVLLASRRMLDSPTLDTRLTFIRRQSGLDSRAALFVLSPVNPSELAEFVQSLQQALYEPAIEYYVAHSKRVRRKRNRHSQPSHNESIRPLVPEGWTVRYEYKMAAFAEFRGQNEVSLKHYQDAYNNLIELLRLPAIQPRTKRWSEVRLLSDCINVKICKFFLYNGEHGLALSQHNTHIRLMTDLLRGWSINDETFEYWGWVARQWRLLAELIDQGVQSTLKIPIPEPLVLQEDVLKQANAAYPRLDVKKNLGINPIGTLQHSGFYYVLAAQATEMRRLKFKAVLQSEAPVSASNLSNERKVDHLAVIVELYTKAYEVFKKYHTSQGRLLLRVAYRIARAHFLSGNYQMVLRFLERISKNYQRDQWDVMRKPLLSTWYDCARRLGEVELSVKLLIEMAACGFDTIGVTEEDQTENDDEGDSPLVEDLFAIFQSTVPPSSDAFVVDLSGTEPLLDSSAIFWTSKATVGELVPYQISLRAPQSYVLLATTFSSMKIYFTEDTPPLEILNETPQEGTSEEPARPMQAVHLGSFELNSAVRTEVKVHLKWLPGGTMVLIGSVSSSTPLNLKVSRVVLKLKNAAWNVEIPLHVGRQRQSVSIAPRWLSSITPPRFIPIYRSNYASVNIIGRPHNLKVTLQHDSPAYAHGPYRVMIEITNTEMDTTYDVTLDVLLQPAESEEDEDANLIWLAESTSEALEGTGQQGSGLIKGFPLGTLSPGITVRTPLWISNVGSAGERTVDVSVQSRRILTSPIQSPVSPLSPTATLGDLGESLQTLQIPVGNPFQAVHEISDEVYIPVKGGAEKWLLDDDDDGDSFDEYSVSTEFTCVGPWEVHVDKIIFVVDNGRVKYSSLDDDDFPLELLPGDAYCSRTNIIAPLLSEDMDITAHYEIHWHRTGSSSLSTSSLTKTKLAITPIKPSRKGLTAILRAPPVAYLHTPISLKLIIRNDHPTRSALVSVVLDTAIPTDGNSEGFVVAGIRNAKIPLLLPGTEEKVQWRLLPVLCGDEVMLPRFRVVNTRDAKKVEEESEGQIAVSEEPVPVVFEWSRGRVRRREGDGDDAVGPGVQAEEQARRMGAIRYLQVLPRDYL